MRTIFDQGSFRKYSQVQLGKNTSCSQYTAGKTTVFVSYKHDDFEDLKGVLGFLEQTYDVKIYLNRFSETTRASSAKTVRNVRNQINKCDKFILLATNNAIKSQWCNWELGYGDAQKDEKHIALFPIKPKGTADSEYKGTAYMLMYPYISYFDVGETYTNGMPVEPGYYICSHKDDNEYITPLGEWFKER
jgi:hypothetical protein